MNEHCHHHLPHHQPKPARPPVQGNTSGIVYTCPMHPEIRQQGPGNCPICGMALEPEAMTGEEGENPELTDFRRRFWNGLLLTLPLLFLEMGGHFVDLHFIDARISNWAQLIFATPVVL